MSVDISEREFPSAVVEASRTAPVVVDFWAEWCGPCRTLTPLLERVAGDAGVNLVKIDVDANQKLAQTFGIQSIPTVLAFRDGVVVDHFIGALPEQSVRQFFAGLAPSEADLLANKGQASGDVGESERLFRSALDLDRDQPIAVVGLARIVGERGEVDEAKALLERIPETEETARLAAQLDLQGHPLDEEGLEVLKQRVATDPFDEDALLLLARALAGRGEHEESLRILLAGVNRGFDDARQVMVEIFTVRGDEDPLVKEYRQKLAAALF